MLIGINIIVLERVDISLLGKKIHLSYYKVDVLVTIKLKPRALKQFYLIHAKTAAIIPPYLTTTVKIH